MGQNAGILRDAHVPLTNRQDEVILKAKRVFGVRRSLDKRPRLGLFAFIYVPPVPPSQPIVCGCLVAAALTPRPAKNKKISHDTNGVVEKQTEWDFSYYLRRQGVDTVTVTMAARLRVAPRSSSDRASNGGGASTARASDSGVPGEGYHIALRAPLPLTLLLSISLYFLAFPSTGSTSCTSSLHIQLHCITLASVRELGAPASRFPFPENSFLQTQKRKHRQQYGSASVQHPGAGQPDPDHRIGTSSHQSDSQALRVLEGEMWDGC